MNSLEAYLEQALLRLGWSVEFFLLDRTGQVTKGQA